MCRLFRLTAGTARVRATFWLLDAPDSLEVHSRRNVDESGIGFFDAAGAWWSSSMYLATLMSS